jgi:hypothetical protein
MIQARIAYRGQTALVRFDGADFLMSEAPAIRELLDQTFTPTHPAFNPQRGGAYTGFDRTNPHEVLDGLAAIRDAGAEVDVLEKPAAPALAPYFEDDRHERYRLHRVIQLDRSRPTHDADHLPDPPAPPMPYAGGRQPRKRPT